MVNVSWQDAKAYTEWLSRKSGHRYRLPSEAEWEYAARAGTATAFSTGDRITPQQASYNHSVSYAGSAVATPPGGTMPVGSYPANAFGLHDMHGNVWEWTEDCFNGNYTGAPTDGAVWSSGNCALRMLRGGSVNVYPQFLRSAFRSWLRKRDCRGFNGTVCGIESVVKRRPQIALVFGQVVDDSHGACGLVDVDEGSFPFGHFRDDGREQRRQGTVGPGRVDCRFDSVGHGRNHPGVSCGLLPLNGAALASSDGRDRLNFLHRGVNGAERSQPVVGVTHDDFSPPGVDDDAQRKCGSAQARSHERRDGNFRLTRASEKE